MTTTLQPTAGASGGRDERSVAEGAGPAEKPAKPAKAARRRRPASLVSRLVLLAGIWSLALLITAGAGLTLLFHGPLGLGEAPARVLAFVAAATVTWWLNRCFTFQVQTGASSWLRYVLITSAGAAINIACYLAVLRVLGTQPLDLVAGVAIGSIVAMGFNFWVSRRWLHRAPRLRRRPPPKSARGRLCHRSRW